MEAQAITPAPQETRTISIPPDGLIVPAECSFCGNKGRVIITVDEAGQVAVQVKS